MRRKLDDSARRFKKDLKNGKNLERMKLDIGLQKED